MADADGQGVPMTDESYEETAALDAQGEAVPAAQVIEDDPPPPEMFVFMRTRGR